MNVRGKNSAGKVMLMSAAAFNLKKWVKSLIKNGPILLRLIFKAFSSFIKDYATRELKFVTLVT